MARGKAGVRHPSMIGWGEKPGEPIQVAPEVGSATRSEVREILAAAAVATDVAPSPAGAQVRKATIAGMPQAEATATPAAAPVGVAGRLNKGTIVGVTGVGGGHIRAEGHDARTMYDSSAAENSALDFQLTSDAIALLEAAGIDRELGVQIALGDVPRKDVETVRKTLASLGVDEKTSLAVLWGCRIVALPVVTPPHQSSSSSPSNVPSPRVGTPTMPPPEQTGSPALTVSGTASSGTSVVLGNEIDEDMKMIASVTPRSNRLLIAVALGLSLAAVGVGYKILDGISDNVSHSAPNRR